MAILPDSCEETPKEGYQIARNEEAPTYRPTPIEAGPKRLSIEEYKRRQARKLEEKLTRIPQTEKPRHKRAGKIVRLRKRLASLKAIVFANPPPPWQTANQIWQQIYALEDEMDKHRNKKMNL